MWLASPVPVPDKPSVIDTLPASPRPWMSFLSRYAAIGLRQLAAHCAPWLRPLSLRVTTAWRNFLREGKAAAAVGSVINRSRQSLSSFPLNSKSSGDLFAFDSEETTPNDSLAGPPSSLTTSDAGNDATTAAAGTSMGTFSRSNSMASSGAGSLAARKSGLMRRILKLATAAGVPLAHVWLAGRAPPPSLTSFPKRGGPKLLLLQDRSRVPMPLVWHHRPSRGPPQQEALARITGHLSRELSSNSLRGSSARGRSSMSCSDSSHRGLRLR